MQDPAAHLDIVGRIVSALTELGLTPVMVGGMALVAIGSRRVTRDFDFVTAHPGEQLEAVASVFYDRGLELVSRVNDEGDVTATIDNRRVAAVRLRLDAPPSAYFFNPKSGLRVDLLFDFPVPASDLARRARRIKVRGRAFLVAADADLLRLKRIARGARSVPGDIEDIRFLQARRRRSRQLRRRSTL